MDHNQSSRGNTDLAFKLVFFTTLFAISLYVIYHLKVLIICLIFAVTIASAMAPIAEAAEKKGMPRTATVLTIYSLIGLLYLCLAIFLIPTVWEQAQKLNEHLPQYFARVMQWLDKLLSFTGQSIGQFGLDINDIRTLAMKLVENTLDMTAGFFGLIVNTILVLFLAGYFVMEANHIWQSLLKWLPPLHRARLEPLIVPLGTRMGGYVRGQLLVAVAVSCFLSIGFSLLGLKYALVLGVLAGLLNLVPYVGSMIATIAAIVVAFNQEPVLALAVIAVYAAEQWVESTFMVPILLGKHVSLHPLIVLVSIIAGASMLGIAGALIAIPVVSACLFLAEEFYLKPINRESSSEQTDIISS